MLIRKAVERRTIPRCYAAAIALRKSYLTRLLAEGQIPGSAHTDELLGEIVQVIRRLAHVNS